MSKLSVFMLIVIFKVAEPLLGLFGEEQSVSVVGKLTCKGKPADDVMVKLYDDGTIYDSKMGSVQTSANGTFRIQGSHKKFRSIDPKVNFYHNCNYDGLCSKKVTIHIPETAVSFGPDSDYTYNMGTIDLADQFKEESTDCIN